MAARASVCHSWLLQLAVAGHGSLPLFSFLTPIQPVGLPLSFCLSVVLRLTSQPHLCNRPPNPSPPFLQTILQIEAVSDIRSEPFTDEGEDLLVDSSQLPLFFCLAHYQGQRDFVNVLLLSLMAESEDVASVSAPFQPASNVAQGNDINVLHTLSRL
jgi:hypothetical protein